MEAFVIQTKLIKTVASPWLTKNPSILPESSKAQQMTAPSLTVFSVQLQCHPAFMRCLCIVQANKVHNKVVSIHCLCNALVCICRVGQNRITAPYMTVCMVISLLKTLYAHCIYLYMYGSGQP